MNGSARAWSGRIDMELRVALQKRLRHISPRCGLYSQWRADRDLRPVGERQINAGQPDCGIAPSGHAASLCSTERPFSTAGRASTSVPERRRISMVFQRPHLFPAFEREGQPALWLQALRTPASQDRLRQRGGGVGDRQSPRPGGEESLRAARNSGWPSAGRSFPTPACS